jgi:hypothetical protein
MGTELVINLQAAEDRKLREMGVFLLGLTHSVAAASDDISAVEVIEKIMKVEL